MTTHAVRLGQIWANRYDSGHTFRIESIDDTHAAVSLVTASQADIVGARPKRHSRVRLDRFRTGYRLVRDAEPTE